MLFGCFKLLDLRYEVKDRFKVITCLLIMLVKKSSCRSNCFENVVKEIDVPAKFQVLYGEIL